MLESFINSRRASGASSKTLRWYENQIGAYLEWCADGDPFAASTVEAFVSHERKRGLSPASVDARWRALRAFCNWLAERGHIGASPFDQIKRPRLPKSEPRRLTMADAMALIDSVPARHWLDYRDRAIISMLWFTGVRSAECAGLLLEDVDTTGRLLYVRGKGNQDRYVPVAQPAIAALVGYLYNRPASALAALWLASDGSFGVGGAIGPDGIRQMIGRRCDDAGLTRATPHMFRHGCATEMLNSGCDMSAVSALLGHSSIAITAQHYARWQTAPLQRHYDDVWRAALTDRQSCDGTAGK